MGTGAEKIALQEPAVCVCLEKSFCVLLGLPLKGPRGQTLKNDR